MPAACFDDETLLQVLAGTAAPDELQQIDEHLLECQACLARVNTLCSLDPLFPLLQNAGAQVSVVETKLAALLVALRDRSLQSTDDLSEHRTQSESCTAPQDLQVFLDRLAEPAAPGELGRLGPFRLLKLLGAGGMGMVFAAEDSGLSRPVALKTLRPELFADRPSVERFLAEARAVARVKNPYVVIIHQVGEIDGIPFFIQELLEGESLETRCRRMPALSAGEIVRIGRELSEGLAAAHGQGLLHRDIKPGNIWLEHPREQVRLLDFGLARAVEGTGQLTAAGVVVGTPAYMSPEQAEGHPLDVRADLFSIGVVLYQLATGRRPFEGVGTLAVLKALATVNPPLAHTLNPAIPPELSQLIDQLLAKDREQRPASALEVSARLSRIAIALKENPRLSVMRSQRFRSAAFWAAVACVLLGGFFLVLTNRDGGYPTAKVDADTPKPVELASETLRDDFEHSSDRSRQPTNVVLAEAFSPTSNPFPKPAVAPFNATQANEFQEAWAVHLGLPVEYTNSLGMKFRLIPPGEYRRGGAEEDLDYWLTKAPPTEVSEWKVWLNAALPAHQVVLTEPFYLCVHETTQQQYTELMGTNPSHFSKTGGGKDLFPAYNTSQHPVEQANWFDARMFCAKLSAREHLAPPPEAPIDNQTPYDPTAYHLPTEAEWEFACRAGTTTRFWTGNDDSSLDSAAWHGTNSELRTHPVGTKQPNPFGMYDIHGNVFEWCDEWFGTDDYQPFASKTAVDPYNVATGTSYRRVIRGGNYFEPPIAAHSSLRRTSAPDGRVTSVGFRVALSTSAVRKLIRLVKLTARTPASSYSWPSNAPPPAILPFDARQAAGHQEAWAEHLGVPIQYTNAVGITFRLIPPGEFLRGSTPEQIKNWKKNLGKTDGPSLAGAEGEGPQHSVIISKPFYIAVTETTRQQYSTGMGKPLPKSPSGNSPPNSPTNENPAQLPIDGVSWFDAVDFCVKLCRDEELPPYYEHTGETVDVLGGDGYHLPSEAEWEFACRAGTLSAYWTGDLGNETFYAAAWVVANSGRRTHPVGLLAANPFGLYDVHGNAREWCEDWMEPTYYRRFVEQPAIDPRGAESSSLRRRVARGGAADSWQLTALSVRRVGAMPNGHVPTMGFRLAWSVEGVREAIRKVKSGSGKNTSWRNWPSDAPPPAISPFDAREAVQHQAAWAKYLGVPVEHVNSRGMKYRLIPPGEFLRGSTREQLETWMNRLTETDAATRDGLIGEGGQHTVVLTQPFFLATTETTREQYISLIGSDPSPLSRADMQADDTTKAGAGQLPVYNLPWIDAVNFCLKLSQDEKLGVCYERTGDDVAILRADGYRLPTEAEWEFACRAGTVTEFWTGDTADAALLAAAWIKANSDKRAHPVGLLAVNPFGLYDIHGNVREWCEDWLEPNYYRQFAHGFAVDPRGPGSSSLGRRVNRGGCGVSWEITARSSHRLPLYNKNDINAATGFRTALSIDAVRKAHLKAH